MKIGVMKIEINLACRERFSERRSSSKKNGTGWGFPLCLRLVIFPTLLILLASAPALSLPRSLQDTCEGVMRLRDINCDGEVRIAVIGDSFVAGVGDSPAKRRRKSAGYVPRTARRLKSVTFDNLGFAGFSAVELMTTLAAVFGRGDAPDRVPKAYLTDLRQALLLDDYVILDLGRNDRWGMDPPLSTFVKLTRIKTTIERSVMRETGIKPVVIIPTLMLPNRGSQGPWVKELNLFISGQEGGRDFSAGLRFDEVSKRLIGTDQIHPTAAGYDAIATKFIDFLRRILPNRLATLLR